MQEVQVLLATYNGEKFLTEFLNSLSAQEGVLVNLIVSDDGSTDSTIPIVEKYANAFNSLQILEGPRLGVSENFFFLLRNSSYGFTCLADQDDIWDSSKILHAINALKELPHQNAPGLYVGSVRTMNKKNYLVEKFDSPMNFFRFKNHGMTFVLNPQLLSSINHMRADKEIMYDWYIQCVAELVGNVIYDKQVKATYRLHQENIVGKPTITTKILKYVLLKNRKKWISQIYAQAEGILLQVSELGISQDALVLQNLFKSNFTSRIRLFMILYKKNKNFLQLFWVFVLIFMSGLKSN